MKKNSPAFLTFGLGIILLSSPLLFGAVHSWVSLLLSAWVYLLFFLTPNASGCVKFLPPTLQFPAVFLYAYVILQTFFVSKTPTISQSQCLLWGAYGVFFVLIQALEIKSLYKLFFVFTVIAILESAYGLWQTGGAVEKVLWRFKGLHTGYLTGTYMNRNHMAGFLEMALGIQAGLLLKGFRSKNLFVTLAMLLGLSFCFFALLKTGSRMGIASFLVAAAFFLILLLASRDRVNAYFVVVSSFVAGVALYWGQSALEIRLEEYNFASTAFWGGRLQAWEDVLQLIRDHFWFGTGLGSFEWVFPTYQASTLQWNWTHAHQDYLELMASLGAPAASVLFLSGAFFWGNHTLRLFQKNRWSLADDDVSLLWGGLLGISSILIHAWTDFNFAIPANMFLWIFLCASIERLNQQKIINHD